MFFFFIKFIPFTFEYCKKKKFVKTWLDLYYTWGGGEKRTISLFTMLRLFISKACSFYETPLK